jgi:hypothetical protein
VKDVKNGWYSIPNGSGFEQKMNNRLTHIPLPWAIQITMATLMCCFLAAVRSVFGMVNNGCIGL